MSFELHFINSFSLETEIAQKSSDELSRFPLNSLPYEETRILAHLYRQIDSNEKRKGFSASFWCVSNGLRQFFTNFLVFQFIFVRSWKQKIQERFCKSEPNCLSFLLQGPSYTRLNSSQVEMDTSITFFGKVNHFLWNMIFHSSFGSEILTIKVSLLKPIPFTWNNPVWSSKDTRKALINAFQKNVSSFESRFSRRSYPLNLTPFHVYWTDEAQQLTAPLICICRLSLLRDEKSYVL